VGWRQVQRNCPFFTMCMVSIPAISFCALQNDLNPSIGSTMQLDCSVVLLDEVVKRLCLAQFNIQAGIVVDTFDGIGVELWLDDKIVLEIFRDDTKKTREVTFFQKEVPLALLEESVKKFKKEIPWDFLD
jgi:hypothetical protein